MRKCIVMKLIRPLSQQAFFAGIVRGVSYRACACTLLRCPFVRLVVFVWKYYWNDPTRSISYLPVWLLFEADETRRPLFDS